MDTLTDTSNKDYISLLDTEVKRLEAEEGVVDIKLFRVGFFASQQSVAKGVLHLMGAPVVKDTKLF